MKRRSTKAGRRRRRSSWSRPTSAQEADRPAVQEADRHPAGFQTGSWHFRGSSSTGVGGQHVGAASDPVPSSSFSSENEALGQAYACAPEASQEFGGRQSSGDDEAVVKMDDAAENSHGPDVTMSQKPEGKEEGEEQQQQQQQQQQQHEQAQGDALTHRSPTDMDMDPALLAKWSLSVGLLHGKIDPCGTRSGNWVADSAIFQILEPLTFPEAQHYTCNHEAFELNVCYLEAGHVQIPDTRSKVPKANLLLLVTHILSETEGLHFSAMILNVKCKVLHVFDTLGRQADSVAASVFNQQYPRLKIFQKGFRIQNHTGNLRQSMATCGVWATWLCFAYAMSYRQCRDPITDHVDTAKLQGDVVSFWRELTF